VRVVVAAMASTTTWWLCRGRPRQFIVMWENSRCSTLFHFDCPGQVRHRDGQSGLVGEAGQLGLPQPQPGPVRAAGVGGDQQPPACG
jgi:hypothetical protein